jgi:hypothetical protein
MIEEEGWSELRKYFVRLDQMLAEQTAMQDSENIRLPEFPSGALIEVLMEKEPEARGHAKRKPAKDEVLDIPAFLPRIEGGIRYSQPIDNSRRR